MNDIAQIKANAEKIHDVIAPANIIGGMHALTNENHVQNLEKTMLDMPQAQCYVEHHFGAGVYIRQVTIPAGVFSVGHYQKKEHFNHMVEGRVIMLNDDGTTSDLVAPKMFVSQPGRKIGFIVEKMVWLNIYPTDETDIDTLEEMFLDKSPTWMSDLETKSKIEYVSRHTDREDYKNMLQETSGGGGDVFSMAHFTNSEPLPFPSGSYKVKIADSHIQGRGVYVTSTVKEGEAIAPAVIDGQPTPVIQYINHAKNPNVKLVNINGQIELVALKDIEGAHGGQSGTEATINYRHPVLMAQEEEYLCQPQ